MFYSYYNPNLIMDERYDKVTSLNPNDALLYGNIFQSQYIPYKKYVPNLENAKTNKEELIRQIEMYSEAAQDLKLYLDINPTDKEIFSLFQNYSEKVNKLVKEYENKYSPIFAGNSKFENGYFSWITSPSVFYVG